MFRPSSLTAMPDAELNRWIKRLGLLLVLGIVAFVAFYAVDRIRISPAAIPDQKTGALEQAVRDNPADFSARGQLADVYLAQGRYTDAITQYDEIIKANKDLEAAYASRGRAYELTKQLDAAKADYAKVVDIAKDGEMAKVDQTLELAYYGLASVALQQANPQEAVDQLLKALVIGPTDADAMNLLGGAYVALDKPKDAIRPLRSAVAFVPVGWADPYATLAQAYTKDGQADEATWATALATLATGDAATTKQSLQTIVDGPAKVDAFVGLGLVAEAQHDAATAADWYRKALAIDSSNDMASFGLGRTGAPSSSAAPGGAAPAAPSPSLSSVGS